MIKSRKNEVILKLIERVFNDPKLQNHLHPSINNEKLKIENPLLFETIGEFNKIFDFLISEEIPDNAPVAETLIKFRSLGSETSESVVDYPVHLRNILVEIFSAEIHKNIEILLNINIRIDKLIFSAMNFMLKTREEIFKIKLNELRQGTFANETTGCPSALWQDG